VVLLTCIIERLMLNVENPAAKHSPSKGKSLRSWTVFKGLKGTIFTTVRRM
jgi:hypothetical protein